MFPRTDLKQFPRYQQAVRTVAKLKKHIAERRRDNLHKLTTRLVKDYDTIVVESLIDRSSPGTARLVWIMTLL
ncbi:transposase [Ligilactobacillus ruminis]|uniref:transposase n=1 Tax=Ligilactobacillus ruminis TaxID=1623 RepID=UPI003B634C5B